MRRAIKTKKILVAFLLAMVVFGSLAAPAQAKEYSPEEISFSVKTDALTYRVEQGKSVAVKVTIDLSGLVRIRLGEDELDAAWWQKILSFVLAEDPNINGVYAGAMIPGNNPGCTIYCTFDYESDYVTTPADPFPTTITINIPTGSGTKLPGSSSNTPASYELNIFPVLDLRSLGITGADLPYDSNPAKVKIEVYKAGTLGDKTPTDGEGEVQVTQIPSTSTSGSNIAGNAFLAGIYGMLNGFMSAWTAFIKWIGLFLVVPVLEATLSMAASDILTPVVDGWQFVRDVMNMVFILVLIIIAFGTMLRIESYSYRKLLVNLIIMALLVNFSLLIGRVIIEIADTAQFEFLPITGQGSGSIQMKSLYKHLTEININVMIEAINKTGQIPSQPMILTFDMFFRFFVTLVTVLTFAVVAAFLMIRFIVLWILLILSPVAYALFALPPAAKYAKEWWDTFIKYALFAPIVAFFLRITLSFYENGLRLVPNTASFAPDAIDRAKSLPGFVTSFLGTSGEGNLKIALYLSVIQIIVLGMLWASVLVSKKMSIAGAGIIGNFATRGFKMPYLLSGMAAGAVGALAWKTGGKYVGRKWNELTVNKILGHGEKISTGRQIAFALANPLAFGRGMMKRGEELSHTQIEKSTQGGQAVAEQMFTRGKVIRARVYDVEYKEAAEQAKVIESYKRDQMVEETKRVAKLGYKDEEAKQKRAVLMKDFSEGYLDDGVQDAVKGSPELQAKMKEYLVKDLIKVGLTPEQADVKADQHLWYEDANDIDKTTGKPTRKIRYDPEMSNAQLFLRALFDEKDDHHDVTSWRMIAEAGEVEGKRTNHGEYMSLSNLKEDGTYGPSGRWVAGPNPGEAVWDNEKGMVFAAREWAKLPSRQQAAIAFHAIRGLDDSGNINKPLWDASSNALAESPTFAQQRTASKLLTGDQDYDIGQITSTGEMRVDKASLEAVKKMFGSGPVGALAVGGLYNRMLGLEVTKGPINQTLAKGITIVDRDNPADRVILRDEKAQASLEPEGAAVNDSELKDHVKGEQKEPIRQKLGQETSSGAIPQMDNLVQAIDKLTNNLSSATKISGNYLGKYIDKKLGKIDTARELKGSFSDPDSYLRLAPSEVLKLTEAVAQGAKAGLMQGSRHPISNTSARTSDIKNAIVRSIKEVKIPNLTDEGDINNNIRIDRLASSIHSKANSP